MAFRIFKRLRDLTDVDSSAIADGKVPVYRSASGKHEYETPSVSVAASAVSNTPAGNIAATNVQSALNELDSEKAAVEFALAMAVAL